MGIVRCDIETRSRVDLKKAGVYRYVECPDFKILMCSWSIDGEPAWNTQGDNTLDVFTALQAAGHEFEAHNANFERVCFSSAIGLPTGDYLDPWEWRCSSALARLKGLPASLENAARALKAAPKDSAGSNLIRLFCIPRPDGGFNDEHSHPEEWEAFVAYCNQDVDTLVGISDLLGKWPESELEIWRYDQIVNDVGILIDSDLARAARDAAELNQFVHQHEVIRLTGVENPGSTQQMMSWARSEGLEEILPNLQAETVSEALETPLEDHQRGVLELRQELAGSASKKYASALATMCSDDRVRGAFYYHGGHTGRWAGRALQFQNFPRASFETEEEVEAAIADVLAGKQVDAQTLKALVRPMLLGPMTVVDFSAIEARIGAWVANETWALEFFRWYDSLPKDDPRRETDDFYVTTASQMGDGYSRSQGKIAALALQFGGAVGALRGMGADGTDEELAELTRIWRRANKRIVAFWRRIDDALEKGGRVSRHLKILRKGSTMALKLPSGRLMQFHSFKRDTYHIPDPDDPEKKIRKVSWRYRDPDPKKGRTHTYGGRLAENAIQGIARDVMAQAIVNLIEAGYTVLGHVHDEALVEGEHDPDEIAGVMCRMPEWADGLPLAAEGFITNRYRKG